VSYTLSAAKRFRAVRSLQPQNERSARFSAAIRFDGASAVSLSIDFVDMLSPFFD